MRNYLRFVSSAVVQPTKEDIKTASNVDDINAIIEATEAAPEYEFSKDTTLDKTYKTGLQSVEIEVRKFDDGGLANRAKVVRMVAGKKKVHYLRCFGVKDNLHPAGLLTDAELKKIQFGFCEAGGEVIRDEKFNPATGEVMSIKRVYLNLA